MPGHRRRASPTLVPVFTPKGLASTLAAMHTVVSASIGTTPRGFPRSRGSTCCSTEAKYELKSTSRERSVTSLARHAHGTIRRLHELPPEDQRVGDVLHGCHRGAGAGHEHGAVVEHAREEPLLDPQGL